MFRVVSYALTINQSYEPTTELYWNEEPYLYADDPCSRR
jgi:hypothetical protein